METDSEEDSDFEVESAGNDAAEIPGSATLDPPGAATLVPPGAATLVPEVSSADFCNWNFIDLGNNSYKCHNCNKTKITKSGTSWRNLIAHTGISSYRIGMQAGWSKYWQAAKSSKSGKLSYFQISDEAKKISGGLK
jgi:hypothetical protein